MNYGNYGLEQDLGISYLLTDQEDIPEPLATRKCGPENVDQGMFRG